MAISDREINQIVQYFTGKNQALLAPLQQQAVKFAPGPDSGSSSGGSTSGGTAAIHAAARAANYQKGTDTLAEVDRRKKDQSAHNTVNALLRMIPGVGGMLGDLNNAAHDIGGPIVDAAEGITRDIFAPRGDAERAKNTSQWVVDALGTGTNITANIGNEVGRALTKTYEAGNDNAKGMQGFGELLAAPITGIVRGVGEGLFQQRYDRNGDGVEEKPRTWGQNLQDLGVNDAIRGAATGLGATQDGAHFFDNPETYVGAAGFGLDSIGDPLSWVTGTGAVKGLSAAADAMGGSVRAARAAKAVGESGDTLLMSAGRGVGAGFKAAAAAREEARAARAATKVGNRETRAAAKAGVASRTLDETLAADEAARQAAFAADRAVPAEPVPAHAAAPAAPEQAAALADEAASAADEAVRTVEPTTLADTARPAADPRKAAIDELLPSLHTEPKPVDAAGILAGAAGTAPAKLSPAAAEPLLHALNTAEKVPDLEKAVKAAKATPEGKAFLARTIKYQGKDLTVEQAVVKAGMARLTGGGVGGAGLGGLSAGDHTVALHRTLNDAIGRLAAPGKGHTTPESLSAAIGAAGHDAGAVDPAELYQRLLPATPTQRVDILKQVLGESAGTTFKTFDEAINAAVDGQVEASMMRTMLKALGIQATSKWKKETLQKALGTRGRATWEEIQAAIPTPREVLADHDIPADVAAEAEHINVDRVIAAAEDDLAETLAEAEALDVDFAAGTVADPLPNPRVGGGSTRQKAMDALGEITPHTVEEKNAAKWYSVWAAVIRNRAVPTNTRRGAETGLTGAARANALYEGVGADLRVVEAYARSKGVMPYLQTTKRAKPVYVSFGQIYDALPAEPVKRALFDLDYQNARFGKGKSDAAVASYSDRPLTVLPTTFGAGAEAAIAGKDAAGIIAAMKAARHPGHAPKEGKPGSFEYTPAGEKAIGDLAAAFADPAVAAHLRSLHEAQEVVALAFMRKAADQIIAPLAAKFIRAVSEGGDREQVTAAIDELTAEAAKIAPSLDQSLVRDIVAQRSSNGILNALNREGVALVRSDKRAKARAGNRSATAQGAAHKAAEEAQKAGKRKPASIATDTAQRGQIAKDNRALMDDLEPMIEHKIDEEVAAGYLEDADRVRVESRESMDATLGFASVFAQLGRGVFASWGMPLIDNLRVSAVSGSHAASHDFINAVNTWQWGGKLGRPMMFGTRRYQQGLDTRLGQALGLGRKASDEEIGQHVGAWWNALAAHTSRLQEEGGAMPDADTVRLALAAGMRGIDHLDAAQTEMAMELYGFIGHVFGTGDGGPLARAGVVTSDMAKELSHHGLDHEMLPQDLGVGLADHATIWRQYNLEAVKNPVTILATWRKALDAAQVPVRIGSELSRKFDHVAEGIPAAEARARGWKKLDTTAGGYSRVAPYVDPDSYFPPEIIRGLTNLEHFMRAMEKGLIGGEKMRKWVIAPNDFITNTLKPLQTVWNIAHHVGNVLGENAMLVMDGRNPAYQLRAVHVLKAGGKLSQVGDDVFGVLRGNAAQAASDIPAEQARFAAKWLGKDGGTVHVNINGQMTAVSPERLWQMAMDDGVAVTAKESLDRMPGADTSGVAPRKWTRTMAKLNPFTRGNRYLGDFSAVRDNFTRIAHYMAVLEDGSYKSFAAAREAAAKKVHEFHPTIQGLSPFDQKYTRRVIYFHTWVRKAAEIVVTTALERPGYVSAPFKLQYNWAEAAGMDPESFGQPFGDDPRIADYYRRGLLAPTYSGGLSPLGGTGDLDPGEAPHQWGISLSMPQIDALQTLFGGIPLGKDPAQTALGVGETLAGNLVPGIRVPGELIAHSRVGGIGKDPWQDPNYLPSQTGMPYRLTTAFGGNPKYDVTKAKTPEEAARLQRQNEGEQSRVLFAWLSGVKPVDYTNPTSAGVAERDRGTKQTQDLQALGFDKNEIKDIKALWKERGLTP